MARRGHAHDRPHRRSGAGARVRLHRRAAGAAAPATRRPGPGQSQELHGPGRRVRPSADRLRGRLRRRDRGLFRAPLSGDRAPDLFHPGADQHAAKPAAAEARRAAAPLDPQRRRRPHRPAGGVPRTAGTRGSWTSTASTATIRATSGSRWSLAAASSSSIPGNSTSSPRRRTWKYRSCRRAEMTPIDPSVGEFRVHYAGFFDPGFGTEEAHGGGSKGVLEVRSHETPFLLEDGQTVARPGLRAADRASDPPLRPVRLPLSAPGPEALQALPALVSPRPRAPAPAGRRGRCPSRPGW